MLAPAVSPPLNCKSFNASLSTKACSASVGFIILLGESENDGEYPDIAVEIIWSKSTAIAIALRTSTLSSPFDSILKNAVGIVAHK